MVQYDRNIIQTFAERLYSQATSIVIFFGVVGFLMAGGMGMAVGASSDSGVGWGLGFGIVGAIIGAVVGNQIAFFLKLRAQMALCQMKIEENTSRTVASVRTRRAAASGGQAAGNTGVTTCPQCGVAAMPHQAECEQCGASLS